MSHVDYVLAELRCAALRARLSAAEIDAVGVALKERLIDSEHALELLREAGILLLVGPSKEQVTDGKVE